MLESNITAVSKISAGNKFNVAGGVGKLNEATMLYCSHFAGERERATLTLKQ